MSSKHHQKVYGCLAVSALHSAKELLESHSLYSDLAQSDFLKSDNNKWVILLLTIRSKLYFGTATATGQQNPHSTP